MNKQQLESVAQALVHKGKGILAADVDYLDQVFALAGAIVHFAALDPWVHKCAQADGGDKPGALGGDLAVELGHHALGEVVGFALVGGDHLDEGVVEAHMAGDEPLDHAREGEVVHPPLLLAAGVPDAAPPQAVTQNPGYPFGVHPLSRRTDSTALAPLPYNFS